MHAAILEEFGYGENLLWALNQVYSARWRLRDDPEMASFFKTLVHVQLDFTGDGNLQIGGVAPSVPLCRLDSSSTSLQAFIDFAKAESKPLVVFAGSWT